MRMRVRVLPGTFMRDQRVLKFPAPLHLRARRVHARPRVSPARREVVPRQPLDAAQQCKCDRDRPVWLLESLVVREPAVREHEAALPVTNVDESFLRVRGEGSLEPRVVVLRDADGTRYDADVMLGVRAVRADSG